MLRVVGRAMAAVMAAPTATVAVAAVGRVVVAAAAVAAVVATVLKTMAAVVVAAEGVAAVWRQRRRQWFWLAGGVCGGVEKGERVEVEVSTAAEDMIELREEMQGIYSRRGGAGRQSWQGVRPTNPWALELRVSERGVQPVQWLVCRPGGLQGGGRVVGYSDLVRCGCCSQSCCSLLCLMLTAALVFCGPLRRSFFFGSLSSPLLTRQRVLGARKWRRRRSPGVTQPLERPGA